MSQNHSEIALQRFQAMGLSARMMPGEKCVVASMPLGEAPFHGPAGAQRFKGVLFSTVGADRIKCLRPLALFSLPIISIRGCREPASIEARIRHAWQKHASQIARTRDWLRTIGTETTTREGGSVICFPIEGEDPRARANMIDRNHVVLPTRGPLAGVPLCSREERVVELDGDITSGLSLDIALSARLGELSKRAARASENRRVAALTLAPAIVAPPPNAPGARHILAVGPRLSAEHSAIASLRLRGYNVTTAASQQEALLCFDRISPQLVLSDVDLGRSDGIELILALRNIAGVEDFPVILVDSHNRPSTREAARQVGAVGYIVYPIEISRITEHLSRIITSPRQRRFTRYASRLPVRLSGGKDAFVASALGRGGMYLSTRQVLDINTVRRCQISLPEVGQMLRVDAEVIYSASTTSSQGHGVGLRFREFPESNEELLIQYLRTLEKSATGP